MRRGVNQMSDTIRAAAEELKREITQKVEVLKSDPNMTEVLKLHQALNTLEQVTGDPLTTLAKLFGMEDRASVSMRPDEFYGLQPLEAAKRYLKKRGEARPFQEIVDAIVAGGCRSADGNDLRISLARSTYEIAKVGQDLYGLVEFYPHIRRGKKKKTETLSEALEEGWEQVKGQESKKEEAVNE
jgi:hypothetical protein